MKKVIALALAATMLATPASAKGLLSTLGKASLIVGGGALLYDAYKKHKENQAKTGATKLPSNPNQSGSSGPGTLGSLLGIPSSPSSGQGRSY